MALFFVLSVTTTSDLFQSRISWAPLTAHGCRAAAQSLFWMFLTSSVVHSVTSSTGNIQVSRTGRQFLWKSINRLVAKCQTSDSTMTSMAFSLCYALFKLQRSFPVATDLLLSVSLVERSENRWSAFEMWISFMWRNSNSGMFFGMHQASWIRMMSKVNWRFVR